MIFVSLNSWETEKTMFKKSFNISYFKYVPSKTIIKDSQPKSSLEKKNSKVFKINTK